MANIHKERMTVENEREIVVFLIGMRINKVWKLHKWLPALFAMPRMLSELSKHPDMGLLGYHLHFGFPGILVVQYWRSFEDLATYAGSKDAAHLPAWRDFNRRVATGGDVGIWHETYRVGAGQYETVYANMPAYGLGNVLPLVPAINHRTSAVARMHTANRNREIAH